MNVSNFPAAECEPQVTAVPEHSFRHLSLVQFFRGKHFHLFLVAGCLLWFTVLNSFAGDNLEIVLANDSCRVTVNPASFQINLQPRNQGSILLSSGQSGLGPIASLDKSGTSASWEFSDRKIRVGLQLVSEGLLVDLLAETTGKFTFPILPESDSTKGWILPLFEGVYAPRGDSRWVAFLTNSGTMNTTADLTMPFLGLDYGDFTVACILTNPFNNQLRFQTAPDGRLEARVTHEFTRNHPVKECGMLFRLGNNSPVEPGRLYREWLKQHGDFVTLADKIKKTPEGAKLLGAAHIYLWGDELITPDDAANWKQFAAKIKSQGEASEPSPGKRIWSLLKPDARKAVGDLIGQEWPDRYTKLQIAEGLDQLLLNRDFYDAAAWTGVGLDQLTMASLNSDRSNWTQADLCRVNCHLLAAAFPSLMAKPEMWGDGISPKMIQQLAQAGFDRLWLGAGGWEGFVNRPETVAAAKQAGYLIGPYDSYNSIHRPSDPDTWPTAQFDETLYETGAIVNADGGKKHGFKKKGWLLSPDAARPYVERRVGGLMKLFGANSWFMDCDGFGDYFDDYSTVHPATQQSDLQSRRARLAWIRDTFGAVVGSEGCSAGVAPDIFFAHGVMTPVIGWGDHDLSDKGSKYYLGRYYPPNGPEVFFKPVPLKEEYRYIYFEPRFRLPLFQTVFHDSVITTHHWSFGSWKSRDEAGTVELLELLYNVPPLYHLNLQEFQKRKQQMRRHYDFFSPLHREAAVLPMTAFQWLTPDRSVQRTAFGDKIEMIANFGSTDFTNQTLNIPKRSILARWLDTGKTLTYSPLPKPEK